MRDQLLSDVVELLPLHHADDQDEHEVSLGVHAQVVHIVLDAVENDGLLLLSVDHLDESLHRVGSDFVTANLDEVLLQLLKNSDPLLRGRIVEKLLTKVITVIVDNQNGKLLKDFFDDLVNMVRGRLFEEVLQGQRRLVGFQLLTEPSLVRVVLIQRGGRGVGVDGPGFLLLRLAPLAAMRLFEEEVFLVLILLLVLLLLLLLDLLRLLLLGGCLIALRVFQLGRESLRRNTVIKAVYVVILFYLRIKWLGA